MEATPSERRTFLSFESIIFPSRSSSSLGSLDYYCMIYLDELMQCRFQTFIFIRVNIHL